MGMHYNSLVVGIPETEAGQVWRAMREARVRSLYFGELAARYTRRQQWVQGLSLAFGSAAFVTLVREPWPLVAAGCAAVVAVANVWATATNLNQTQATLVMLRTAWEGLRLEYGDVWSNWYRDGAEAKFEALQRRSNDLGMLANAGVPWDRKTVRRWEDFVDSEWSREDAECPAPAE